MFKKILFTISLALTPALSHAALIHHYTFDVSVGADTGTIGGRDLIEQTRGTGGTVSQQGSVTDSNGLTRTGVLRIKEGDPATAADADTANGSWMEHNAGVSTTLASYTVALWFRTDIESNAGFSSMFSNGPNNHFQIDNGNNGITPDDIRLLGQGGVSVNDPSSFAVDTWIHLAVTRDATTTKFYINGTQFGGDIAANPGPEFQEIRLGSNRGQSRLFDGDFDDFRIYDNALSAAEVAALIPEPSTTGLALLGLLGCILRRRR